MAKTVFVLLQFEEGRSGTDVPAMSGKLLRSVGQQELNTLNFLLGRFYQAFNQYWGDVMSDKKS